MESEQIKNSRRAKFLEKMNKKKKENANSTFFSSTPEIKKTTLSNNSNVINQNPKSNDPKSFLNSNLNNLISNTNPQDQSKSPFKSLENYHTPTPMPNITDMNKQGYINYNNNNNSSSNINSNLFNNNEKKINLTEILDKMNQIDYTLNLLAIFKKILIIILSLLHCFKISAIKDHKTLKYTYLVLELSFLFICNYFNKQKKSISQSISSDNNNLQANQGQIQIEKISNFLVSNFGIFNQFFNIYNTVKDIIVDISLLFIINVLYFIFTEEDD